MFGVFGVILTCMRVMIRSAPASRMVRPTTLLVPALPLRWFLRLSERPAGANNNALPATPLPGDHPPWPIAGLAPPPAPPPPASPTPPHPPPLSPHTPPSSSRPLGVRTYPPSIISSFQPHPPCRPRARVSTRAEGGAGSSTAPLPLLAPVLACVAVSCAGALAFGYHLAVVNGPLDAITRDIGIAGNKSLEGMVRATLGFRGLGGSPWMPSRTASASRETGRWRAWCVPRCAPPGLVEVGS